MMSKTKTRAQMKAKKGWLLHKPPGKKARCRRQQRRENINMAPDLNVTTPPLCTTKAKDNLLTCDGNKEFVRSSLSGHGVVFVSKFYGGVNFNSCMELLYNLMASGIQRLKHFSEQLCSTPQALFPSRSHKRKFEEVTQRLDELEDEVKRLKLELTKVTRCHHHRTLSDSHSESEIPTTSGSTAPVMPPPPPPPPPPPLVPPPPVFTVVKKKPKTSAEPKLTTAAKAVITLEDLLSVKLRSTKVRSRSDAAENGNLSDDTSNNLSRVPLQHLPINQNRTIKQPVVNLKDIQGVSLRKLHHVDVDTALKINTGSPENSVLTTMRNLRRVNVNRSPGGTPVVTERQESTGTGLTPMMTRALKRKFQFANPPSSSPKSSHRSGRSKSLSPLVSSPWSPLSKRDESFSSTRTTLII